MSKDAMTRDIELEFCVQFSPEQVDLAWEAVMASAKADGILKKIKDESVDWKGTAQRVISTCSHVYLSLLLMQAKREQRSIPNSSIDLARERKHVLSTMSQLSTRLLGPEDILNWISLRSGLETEYLRSLADPIRRDLARLQESGTQERLRIQARPVDPKG
jgi:hypothetical protein